MHICKLMFISCFHTNRNSAQCLFYYNYLFHLQTGSIPKRSPDKNEQFEPGRYLDHSHKFFIRKFWILPILKNDRSGRFGYKYVKKSKYRVVCSPLFKINWIIFRYYEGGMSLVLWKALMKLEVFTSPSSNTKITQLKAISLWRLCTRKFPTSTAVLVFAFPYFHRIKNS